MRRIVTYQPTLGETAIAILDELATATLAAFYPHPYYHKFCAHAHRRSLYNSLKRLEQRRLVGVERRGRREEWRLTSEGKKLARRLKMKLEQAGAQRWDKKWRLVVFDIPERIRDRRNFLRNELAALGLRQLQKSVWVTPYPLPEEFSEVVSELELGKHFRVVVAERISDDRDLRAVFFPPA